MPETFDICNIQGKEFIFDNIRKKYVLLTPEEWVRQHILSHLIQEKKYPQSVIAVEKAVKVGNRSKRFDILIYKQAKPWMLIECKSPQVKLGKQVLSQILSYHSTFQAHYLIITNGNELMCYNTHYNNWQNQIPDYEY